MSGCGSEKECSMYKHAEEQVAKKYRGYFGGGMVEIYGQKCNNSNVNSNVVVSYDLAIKTPLGYFTLTANILNTDTIQLSVLKKVT
jgi:hypothetical protein